MLADSVGKNQFHCSMCGMCCRNVKRYKEEVYPALKSILGDSTPRFDIIDKNGVCVHLTEDNKCSIYERRPFICNTNKMFRLLSKALGIPIEDLFMAQSLSCAINRNNYNTNLKKQ